MSEVKLSLKHRMEQCEEELEGVRAKMFLLVCGELQRACDRYGWNCSTASCWDVWKRSAEGVPFHAREQIETTTTERLFDVITWYEDEFRGGFPQVMYKGGTWYPKHLDFSGIEL